MSEVPAVVHEVLRSPGRPLEAATREYFEPRFGHDFSRMSLHPVAPQGARDAMTVGEADDFHEREADRVAERLMQTPVRQGRNQAAPPTAIDFSHVRVHTDARAAESARALNAQAYTLGSHIVFDTGRYAPGTEEGGKLLAHELAHVVQQRGHGAERQTVRRKGGSFTGFFSKIGRGIASIFGGGGNFSEETLQGYLKGLDDEGDIEDDFDSDFKARAVVNAWRLGGSPFVLTERRKALLIREMQKGVTGDDDEMAILEILERSHNFELSFIFGAGGVKVSDLNSDFHGEEFDRLKDFYGRRFEDPDSMIKGVMSKPVGLPIGMGAGMPFIGSMLQADDLPGAKPEWNVPCVLGILCAEDATVVSQLPKLTVRKADKVTEVYWEYDGASWKNLTRERGAFSNAGLKVIGLKNTATCPSAAESIVHEVRHQNQPSNWTTEEKEKDAYTFEEDWALKRGLPSPHGFRTTKPGTQEETVDVAAVEKHVAKRYSGATGTAGEEITGHDTTTGETEIELPGGGTKKRPPQKGDSHQDVAKTDANLNSLPTVDPKEWVCPKTK